MSGQLQVRQGIVLSSLVAEIDGSDGNYEVKWSPWVDVQSPGWLFGYMIPDTGFVYELRTTLEAP